MDILFKWIIIFQFTHLFVETDFSKISMTHEYSMVYTKGTLMLGHLGVKNTTERRSCFISADECGSWEW